MARHARWLLVALQGRSASARPRTAVLVGRPGRNAGNRLHGRGWPNHLGHMEQRQGRDAQRHRASHVKDPCRRPQRGVQPQRSADAGGGCQLLEAAHEDRQYRNLRGDGPRRGEWRPRHDGFRAWLRRRDRVHAERHRLY